MEISQAIVPGKVGLINGANTPVYQDELEDIKPASQVNGKRKAEEQLEDNKGPYKR